MFFIDMELHIKKDICKPAVYQKGHSRSIITSPIPKTTFRAICWRAKKYKQYGMKIGSYKDGLAPYSGEYDM